MAAGHKYVGMCGWDDVPHLSEEQKAALYANLQPFEREARSKGIPSLGAGAIYPVPEDFFLVNPFRIPDYFEQCYALDVGWQRTAALWAARDPETDTTYLYSEHYRGEAEPPIHAQAIRARGSWIPGVIDPAARGRSQKDGVSLFNTYKELGLESLTLADNSLTGPDGGIYQVWIRLSTGRLKVFRTLENWLAEQRFYQRDEKGRIKDGQKDHLMDCTRYIVLSGLKVAINRPADKWRTTPGAVSHAYDYDPLAR